MKTIYKSLILLFFVTTTSCLSVLDKKDLSAITEEDVWNSDAYATAFIDRLYAANLPGWDPYTSNYSDEGHGETGILYGQLTVNSMNNWPYANIRDINTLLVKVETGNLSEETKLSLKAQAKVLRAYRYFTMVRLYGGVPILTKPQDIKDELYITRNKTSECIDFIIKDLDEAFEDLPWKWLGKDEGRFSKATVMAFKGRVLLYYASPQFNPTNDASRWEKAYEYNKKAAEEIEANGYGLYEDYADLWLDEMNKEVLFVKRYQEPGITHYWDAGTRPLSEAQNYSGFNQPTKEMVESYPMNTGESITESSKYDPIHYWKNRDPRFYSTIAYNGSIWELSGKTGRIQWTYNGHSTLNPTPSGFYCRKAINVSYSPYFTERSSTDWIEIRFAEVLLNYAESAAEVGKNDEAYDAIKRIRKRAGIEAGANNLYGLKPALDKEALIMAVMDERKIEFAYEGKRYWDLRRRRMFSENLNGKKRHGLLPKLKISADEFDKIKDNFNMETDYNRVFKDSVVVLDQKYSIDFKDNYYFYAIPTSHIESNSKIEQTQGWDDGEFNPYE